MSLSINIRQTEDVSIVDVVGRVTLGDGAASLRDALRKMGRDGRKKILLNLAETTNIDSSGLGVLVAGFASVANHGGQLKLVSLTSRVHNLLLITKLYSVFEVFDEEGLGVRSFQGNSARVPALSA